MLKVRLIPVLLLQNGLLVRSESFQSHLIFGNPVHQVARFNEWNVDELIYLDISKENHYDLRREDHRIKGLDDPMKILEEVSKCCFMPLTWGGRIRTIEDMRNRFMRGADKITLNTAAVESPELITQAAKIFGSQAIVVCIDVKRNEDGKKEILIDGGRKEVPGASPEVWAREAEDRGAGEILLQSVDRDGMGIGYDLDLIHSVSKAVTIPVIALGGVGTYEHYVEGVQAGASAVAAANIFFFKDLADRNGKRALQRGGVEVRI